MSDLNEWIKERREWTIHGPISAEADNYGAARFASDGWPISAHGSHATAIVDAHNTLPALLTAVEKVLELHEPVRSYFGDGEYGESEWCGYCRDEGGDLARYPCQTVQEIISSIQSVS